MLQAVFKPQAAPDGAHLERAPRGLGLTLGGVPLLGDGHGDQMAVHGGRDAQQLAARRLLGPVRQQAGLEQLGIGLEVVRGQVKNALKFDRGRIQARQPGHWGLGSVRRTPGAGLGDDQPVAVGEADQALDGILLQPQGARLAHAGQHDHIEQLLDQVAEAQPVHHLAAIQIDHHQPALGRLLVGGQPLFQRQAGEARRAQLGQTHNGVVTAEGQPAHETGGVAERLEALAIQTAELAAAGVEQPKPVAIPARRVGHGQAGGDDGVAGKMQHHTAVVAMMAPAGGLVGLAACGQPGGLAVL